MRPDPLFLTADNLTLCTDLYELTMAAAYLRAGVAAREAVFELYTREVPRQRGFLLAAGLEQALAYLTAARFSGNSIDALRKLPVFNEVDESFFEYLRDFRFTGDVWAMPEGTPFFGNEPIVQVRAPVIEAQVVETLLINTLNVQSMVATKAARFCRAAGSRPVVDFGSRRAHGPQTAVLAARAAYLGGCAGTSNVLAGTRAGIPVMGTMAHSFVQFFDREEDAFRQFQETFPRDAVLLVDTYDAEEGTRRAAGLPGEIAGIRLDSGDLAALSRRSRQILDEHGRTDARILASSGLHEEDLVEFGRLDIPVDGYGVGTDLVVPSDAPGCDLIYKLVEVETAEGPSVPRFKASTAKVSYPHRKQVYRRFEGGKAVEDLVTIFNEALPGDFEGSRPLLAQYLNRGKLCVELPQVNELREAAARRLAELPDSLFGSELQKPYPVRVSQALEHAFKRLTEHYTQENGPSR